jgi:putative component of membrane protein insertase Oxa1/YidC/SpoIIIJ protein YidD
MKKLVLIMSILISVCHLHAQESMDDIAAIKTHINNTEAIQSSSIKSGIKIQKTYNPGKLLLYVPLYFYQRIVSEQISAICGFEPSCSAFSILSIKKLGILEGLLLTADRLTRCNGNAELESAYYLFDHVKVKVIDEPDMYKSIH